MMPVAPAAKLCKPVLVEQHQPAPATPNEGGDQRVMVTSRNLKLEMKACLRGPGRTGSWTRTRPAPFRISRQREKVAEKKRKKAMLEMTVIFALFECQGTGEAYHIECLVSIFVERIHHTLNIFIYHEYALSKSAD
jgi:hypothetical protein